MSSSLRVAIVAPEAVPAVEGGAERLWRALRDGLTDAGHRAEIVTLPFPETTLDEVLAGYQAFRNLDVSDYDVVISGKYPGWMVEHPCQVVYMLHPLRGLADTYPFDLNAALDQATERRLDALRSIDDIDELLSAARSFHDRLDADDPLRAHPSPLGRAVVRRLDELAFAGGRIRHFAAISDEVARRPGYFPSDRAIQVAHPVSDVPIAAAADAGADEPPATSGEGGPTFFTASRHDAPKRIDLIIRAFRRLTDGHNDRQLSLVIAGDGPERDNLEREAGGNERIEFLGRVSEAELAARYRSADVTVFLPLQEDFGYVSLESMLAGTPVLSTTDAGGANELLDHDAVGGVVVEPTIEALANAMDRLADDPFRRWQLGTNGQRRANSITWDPLIASIEMAAAPLSRPKAVMVSTFGIEPAVGGGQRRVRHLARALARRADVTVLALAGGTDDSHGGGSIRRRVIEPGITLVEVPRSPEHRSAEAEITRVAGFPIDDITCGRLWPSTPAFGRELAALASEADVVVASHPFLAPAIDATLDSADRPVPVVVYDSHNAETPFKTALLAEANTSDEARSWLIDAVTEAETTAVHLAAHVSACTDDDLVAVTDLDQGPSHEGGAENGRADAGPSTSVVPNGVDTNAMPLRTAAEHQAARAEALALLGFATDDDRPLAVFIGSWHPPNIDAARLIIDLASSAAGAGTVFGLAGSHTIQFDAAALPPNVKTLPAFAEESLWPLLAGADVALNPMVSGGGSNLKLYDYLSVGVPVLTTPTGARGLDEPDRVVTIAEPTVDALAVGLRRVLDRPTEQASAMASAGRAVAEQADWRLLGTRWSGDVLACIPDGTRASERPWPSVPRPTVAPTTPPDPDPTIELMSRIAIAALDPAPPVEMTAMNPNLRESLKAMRANRYAGRELPHDARLKLPKQALIRAGHAITNEQLVFNEATIGVVDQLSEQVTDLTEQVARLSEQVTDLERRLGDS